MILILADKTDTGIRPVWTRVKSVLLHVILVEKPTSRPLQQLIMAGLDTKIGSGRRTQHKILYKN